MTGPGAHGSSHGTHETLRLSRAAHGGHMVARNAEGRVVFVRHGLPGESVRVRYTEAEPQASFWRADVTEVLDPAPGRRDAHPWREADALLAALEHRLPVGGAEFGHARSAVQRDLKRSVLTEQLEHLAGYAWDGTVQALPGAPDGTGWRTRMHLDVDRHGRPGMYPHRSDVVLPVTDMPLATRDVRELAPWELTVPGATRLDVAAPSGGGRPLVHVTLPGELTEDQEDELRSRLEPWATAHDVSLTARREGRGGVGTWAGRAHVTESLHLPDLGNFSWRVSPTGFWQVHRDAPAALTRAVLRGADLRPGETVWDLYSGAGLFSAVLARAVGPRGRVFAVEGSPVTSADAEHNHAGDAHVTSVRGDVARVLTGRTGSPRRGRARGARRAEATRTPSPDVVVLDPPRSGAAKDVVAAIDAANPRTIVHVACDPAALARDLGRFQRRGWKPVDVEAFDLYPETHHVEAVAVLERH